MDKIENKRKRVNELGKKSEPGEDLVYDLAKREDKFRDILTGKGIKEDRRKKKENNVVECLADLYSDETLEKLEALCNLQEAERSSLTDKLTGLKNRRALEQEVPKLLEMAEREGKNCAILMIDMDHFKMINDTYGHQAGDMALKILSDILRHNVRKYDFIYRYGGEEFAILLFDADQGGGWKRAEQLRETIEGSKIIVLDQKDEQVVLEKTVSIGYCSTDQIGEYDAEKMIGKADQALYKSKHSGRNCVTSCSELDNSDRN